MPDAKVSFRIDPAPSTLAGAASLRVIETSAVQDSPMQPLLWPRQPQDSAKDEDTKPESESSVTSATAQSNVTISIEEQHAEEDARTLSFLQDPSNHYRLVTDADTNMAVAFVWWQFCKGQTKAQWAEKYATRWRPERMNKELADATVGVQFLRRAQILGDRDIFMLKELYVRPEYQRKGIGGTLVEWGVKRADGLGLVAYTEASPKGLGLYLKYGFMEVDRITVDLEPWGGKEGEVYTYGLLLRTVGGLSDQRDEKA